jgi:glycosyltransferase involved in cell wall biosynthesis
MNHIYFISPDENYPTGGIKTLYRHVDFLNESGFHAFVVHKKKKFRCTWFENQTAVLYQKDFKPDANDFVVIPEVYGPRTAQMWRGPKKIIINQNCYNTFHMYPVEGSDRTTPYLDPEVLATLVVSEDSYRYLTYAFPNLRVVRIHISVDGERFRFHSLAEKKPQIAFMPWKHPQDAAQVINLLKFRGQSDEFQIVPIQKKTESEVAAILRESLLFLSLGYPEGCPAPPLEAMLCGCLVIGYHGIGGKEYFLPELTWPIEINHIIDFAKTVEQVLQVWRTAPQTLESRTRAAREFVVREYPREREKREILDFWNEVIRGNA